MNKKFAYIPTGHRLRLSELSTHEYFGEDFLAGRGSVAVFENAKGQFRAVWSSGDWDTYGLTKGDLVDFQHTQRDGRGQELTFRGTFKADMAVDDEDYPNPKIAQWTLK